MSCKYQVYNPILSLQWIEEVGRVYPYLYLIPVGLLAFSPCHWWLRDRTVSIECHPTESRFRITFGGFRIFQVKHQVLLMVLSTRSSVVFFFLSRALSHSLSLYPKGLCGVSGGDKEGSLKLCMLLNQKLVPGKIMTHRISIIGRGVFKGEGESGHTPRKTQVQNMWYDKSNISCLEFWNEIWS